MATLLTGTTIAGNVALHAGNYSSYSLPIYSNLNTQQVSISLAAGAWYTIAANDSNRASAKFTITDTSSGLHQAIHFYATAHYGQLTGAKITVVSNTYYGGPPVSAIRIMTGSTYDGAMVQIYALSACNLTVSIYDNQQSSGWVIKSGVVSTTNPGTVATFANLTTVAASADLSAGKSFSVSDELYIGGATTQYKALHAGNYSGYSIFSGQVSSSGNNGFANATWSANVRNPIWCFGNATTYGISYFQGSAGIGSSDTIGIHPNGTATSTGSAFSVTPAASYVNNNIVLHAGNYTSYPDATKLPLAGGTLTGGLTVNNNSGVRVYYTADSTNTDYYGYGVQFNRTTSYLRPSSNRTSTLFIGDSVINSLDWASIKFYTNGAFAVNDNTIIHAGNYNSYSPTLTGTGASGSWGISVTGSSASCTGNAATATNLSTNRANWSTNGTISAVVGQLAWKHYGNNHTIIDASNSTAPDGTSISNTNPGTTWSATYPTLMGWNGSSTYGVRVDSSRYADQVNYAPNRTDSTTYPVLWGSGTSTTQAYSCANITIQSSTGTLNATSFSGGELTLSGVGTGAYNHLKYGGTRSGDWQSFTNIAGQINVIQVENFAAGSHSNYPTGVYTYGGVMSWRLANHSFQLYAAHTGALAYKTQWNNDNYSGWVRILESTNYPHAANMNQYVRSTDSPTFADLFISNVCQIRNASPTIVLRDTDHRTGYIHVNSNIFYVLTGAADSGNGSWSQVANSRWPMELNLSNNNATFGADVNAISFTGAGTGLTGTAASLSIGGNAATVTNGVYTTGNQTIAGTKTFSSAIVATNAAKAWVHFNGTGNIGINANYNVSSITDNGTGDYTVNFASAFIDANYVVAGTATLDYTSGSSLYQLVLTVARQTNAQAAGSCRLATEYIHGAQLYDAVAVRAVFYR